MVGNFDGKPSAGYNFNTFQQFKSHSSVLYNERMAILFYQLDIHSVSLNRNYERESLLNVKSTLLQIYKNIRTVIRNNPTMRATMNLETKDEGVYVTDVILDIIDKLIQFCEENGYTYRKIYIITKELNNLEMLLKDILQYYHYFIRPDFRQKPDIEIATEKYKEIADKKTIEELKEIVGSGHKIDFDSLGTERVELKNTEETLFDKNIDEPITEEEEKEIEEEDENINESLTKEEEKELEEEDEK